MTDPAPSDFERQKWEAEHQLKRDELALKERELDIRNRESQRARWSNPLVLAIAGAALAAGGNLIAAYYNSVEQRRLESVKAESQLILEVIKTANPDKAAENLNFLVQTQLIADRSRQAAISQYVTSRTPGTGVSLPSTTEAMLGSAWEQPPVPGILCNVRNVADLHIVADVVNKRVDVRWPGTKTAWNFSDKAASGTSEVHTESVVFLVRHTLSAPGQDTEIRSVLNVPRQSMWGLFNLFGGPNSEFLELEKGLKEDFAKLPSAKVACRLLTAPEGKEASERKAK
jgi:hypothetical protein